MESTTPPASPSPSTPNTGPPASTWRSRAPAALLATSIVVAAVSVPSAHPDAVWWKGALAPLALSCLTVAVVPEAWVRPAQLGALAGIFVAVRLAQWEGPASWLLFGAPMAVAIIAATVPVEKVAWRRGLIVVATVGAASLLGVNLPHQEHVLGPLLQIVVLAEGFSRAGTRSFAAAARYALSSNAAPVTPVPPEDVAAVDRSPRSVIRGGAWAAMGFLLCSSFSQLRGHLDLHPWLALRAGQPLLAAAHGLAFWMVCFSGIAGLFLLDAGTLRMVGTPARSPVDAPWKAVDFLDYWKRANVYRYRVLTEVYFRNFLPARGPWLPASVMAVFMLSGVHHAALANWPNFAMARWVIDGVVSAATAAWRQRGARRRVKAWMARSGVATAAEPLGRRILGAALAVLSAAAILTVHGFLMQLSRPDLPLRQWVRHLLPFWPRHY